MQLRSSRKSKNIRSESISSASSGSIAVRGESFRVNANAGGGNGSTAEANGIDGSKPVTFKWPDNKVIQNTPSFNFFFSTILATVTASTDIYCISFNPKSWGLRSSSIYMFICWEAITISK